MGMAQTQAQLLEEIRGKRLTERRFANLEVKSSWQIDYGQRVCALANRVDFTPSWLVVGITDGGDLCRRDENWIKQQEELISQQLNLFLNPSISVRTPQCFEIEGSWIIILEIRQPGIVVEWNKVAYKAVGSTTIAMSPEEVLELTVALPGLTDFSAQKWAGESDPALVQKFAETLSAHRNEPLFNNLPKLSPDEILERLKIRGRNASKILFGNCQYRVVYYDINNNPIDNSTHEGLFRILSQDFIDSIQLWAKKSGVDSISLIREDPYSLRALREVLANAVSHAAYFESGGEVLVEVFVDKLVVSNLCMRELTVFANKWFSRSHKTTNTLLMEVLRFAGYVDEVGRGKGVIYREAIISGERPPIVDIEDAGRCKRWKLFLYGGKKNAVQIRLLNKLRELYDDEHMALVANALIMWHSEPVSTIRGYIDGESKRIFEKILNDVNGPIFYYQEKDQIVLHRWVRVLLEEGKDSKEFSAEEKEGLRKFAQSFCERFQRGIITPKLFRKLAHLHETASERNLTSRALKEWEKEGHIVNRKHGVYEFIKTEKDSRVVKSLADLLFTQDDGEQIPG